MILPQRKDACIIFKCCYTSLSFINCKQRRNEGLTPTFICRWTKHLTQSGNITPEQCRVRLILAIFSSQVLNDKITTHIIRKQLFKIVLIIDILSKEFNYTINEICKKHPLLHNLRTHYTMDCKLHIQRSTPHPICNNCGHNHFVTDCPKPKF